MCFIINNWSSHTIFYKFLILTLYKVLVYAFSLLSLYSFYSTWFFFFFFLTTTKTALSAPNFVVCFFWESFLLDHRLGAFLLSYNTSSPSVLGSIGDLDNICFTCLLTHICIWDVVANRNMHIHHSIDHWGTASILL